MRWYRRTPQTIADERRRAAADACDRFFFPTRSDQSLGSDPATQDDQDSSADGVQASTSQDNGQANAWAGFGAAHAYVDDPSLILGRRFESPVGAPKARRSAHEEGHGGKLYSVPMWRNDMGHRRDEPDRQFERKGQDRRKAQGCPDGE